MNLIERADYDLAKLRICVGKLDYLSLALKNLCRSNGNLGAEDFRQNVAEISRLLEGQMRWLNRNWLRGDNSSAYSFELRAE